MSKTVDELVKRLRAQGRKNYGLSADAADALEAMAGEVASAREKEMRAQHERDRLKEALERLGSVEAFTTSQGICPELYERITYARKALGGDAS